MEHTESKVQHHEAEARSWATEWRCEAQYDLDDPTDIETSRENDYSSVYNNNKFIYLLCFK